MSSEIKISKTSVIADILREHPECIEVFDRHSMSCRMCMGASTDTVEEGALMHDVDPDVILTELQRCCQGTQPQA